jgi:hypothetical protein
MTLDSVSNVVDATRSRGTPATSAATGPTGTPPFGHGGYRLPGQYGPN